MSEAVKAKVSQFPMTIREAGEQLAQAQMDEKRAKKRADGLKKFLGDNMDKPAVTKETDGSLSIESQGVTRTAWYAPATKWTGVFADMEAMFPSKMYLKVLEIKDKHTTRGYREKFTMEEEE